MAPKSKGAKKAELSSVGKLYLLAYNTVQTLGAGDLRAHNKIMLLFIFFAGGRGWVWTNPLWWGYLLLQTLVYFLNRGSLDNYWTEIKWTVVIFQNAAILEVVHACAGLVPSGVFTTLAQVYSRVFLVCGALLATTGATLSPGLPLCILAWSITETIRYAYYALNLVKLVPHILLVTRYSTFLALYPLGVTGELLCMYHALDEVAERQLWSIAMPNPYNFVFSYYHFLIFYMFLYLPLFPVLFGHMMSQRRKMLGSDRKKSH